MKNTLKNILKRERERGKTYTSLEDIRYSCRLTPAEKSILTKEYNKNNN